MASIMDDLMGGTPIDQVVTEASFVKKCNSYKQVIDSYKDANKAKDENTANLMQSYNNAISALQRVLDEANKLTNVDPSAVSIIQRSLDQLETCRPKLLKGKKEVVQ